MTNSILEELEEAQKDELNDKLIVIGMGNEEKNKKFKDKLIQKYIETEGYNR